MQNGVRVVFCPQKKAQGQQKPHCSCQPYHCYIGGFVAEEDEKLESALACHRRGELAEAAELYRQVLRLNPGKADGLYLFGCLAYQTGNFEAARDLLNRAIAAAGNQPEYHHALALALGALNDHESATASYQRVIALDSGHQRAWYGWGCEENLRGEFAAAKDCFTRAFELQSDWLEARHNLARALYELGMVSEAFRHFKACAETNAPGSEQSRAMMAVIAPGVPELGNAEILAVRRTPVTPKAALPVSPHTPLRVGYVSSFFQSDNWMKPVWGLINQHDRRVVQVHLFSDCAASQIQHGYRTHAEDRYCDTSQLSNEDMAAAIAASEIDVLVDLNGYSNMKRLPLFTRKPAPVVIGWFNMYATTGMDSFDYLIGDSEVVPPEEERFYPEKILRVAGSYLTFDVNYPVPPIVQHNGKVFGSLASAYKITDEVVETWCRILHGCPGSSLLVKNRHLDSAQNRQFFGNRFQKFGIGPERLQLEGPEPHFEFLRAYERMDVALDTFPYNGGTTTTEALWQGVPVVTFYGDRWASRTSASLLRAAGLDEFVASNTDGYVDLAMRLVNHPIKLTREQLRQSAVCDTRGFARQMEALFLEACTKLTCDG